MSRPLAAAILILSILLAGPAGAETIDDAARAHHRGDYKAARRLVTPLAEQGSPKAQSLLGYMHDRGQGVPQDFAEAAEWYRKAAEQGYAPAQHNLGSMYDKGQGVPQDFAEAVRWYRKAADQGDPDAQVNLGTMYALGQGVPQDYVAAHMWFNLAASMYPSTEKDGRFRAERRRDNLASRLTPDQIAEAQKAAREWKPAPGK